jgi:hypothetical protein
LPTNCCSAIFSVNMQKIKCKLLYYSGFLHLCFFLLYCAA